MTNQKLRATVKRLTLMTRIRRRLAEDGMVLKASGIQQLRTLGMFYVVQGHDLVEHGINDLAAYARKLGVLRDWERLVGERDKVEDRPALHLSSDPSP